MQHLFVAKPAHRTIPELVAFQAKAFFKKPRKPSPGLTGLFAFLLYVVRTRLWKTWQNAAGHNSRRVTNEQHDFHNFIG